MALKVAPNRSRVQSALAAAKVAEATAKSNLDAAREAYAARDGSSEPSVITIAELCKEFAQGLEVPPLTFCLASPRFLDDCTYSLPITDVAYALQRRPSTVRNF
jgi:hypothetical protein